jgi:hypothetical protein
MGMRAEKIAVETDLFEHRTVRPHFINPCCFGEDFATWLKNHLKDSRFELGEPIQEDYGWGFFATSGKEKYWIAISYVGDGPQEPPPQWVISVVPSLGLNPFKRLFRLADAASLIELRDRVKSVISSEPRIRFVSLPNYAP